ncbi:MAG: hypothetical protein WC047_03770 [Kiritimatiellales bacterium]
MKIRIQFTPALTAATLCATGWFAFWLIAFRPAPLRPVGTSMHPEVIRLLADDATLNKLKTPTLFALPSAEGFSGSFIENRVDLQLSLEKSADPVRYLARKNMTAPGVDQMLLTEKTALPHTALPVPGVAPRAAILPASGTRLFLSPGLKARAGEIPPLNITAAGLPDTVRAHLAVRPDGTVEYVFFDTPVTNAALRKIIQLLPFKPVKEKTEGWIDIRFAQEGTE